MSSSPYAEESHSITFDGSGVIPSDISGFEVGPSDGSCVRPITVNEEALSDLKLSEWILGSSTSLSRCHTDGFWQRNIFNLKHAVILSLLTGMHIVTIHTYFNRTFSRAQSGLSGSRKIVSSRAQSGSAGSVDNFAKFLHFRIVREDRDISLSLFLISGFSIPHDAQSGSAGTVIKRQFPRS